MVKNFGGNRQKKQGRKFLTAPRNNKLRTADEDEEMYGCVSKLLGNGLAHVTGIDGKQRLLIIRNKFRGIGKRDNTLKPGTIVLIGNRDWETSCGDKLDKCDLLEVYNDTEYTKLKDKVLVDWNVFNNVIPSNYSNNNDDYEVSFGFGNGIRYLPDTILAFLRLFFSESAIFHENIIPRLSVESLCWISLLFLKCTAMESL